MSRTHSHPCAWAGAGCTGRLICSDQYLVRNHDPEGHTCCANPFDSVECEACHDSRCDECGHILSIDKHDDDCSGAQV